MDEKYKMISLHYRNLWWSLSSDFNIDMDTYSEGEKKKKEKEFNTLIDRIIKYIESFPEDISKRKIWRDKGNKYIDKIISTDGMFKLGIIDKDMKDKFIKATKEFISSSKKFDKNLSYEDIGQAMRNLWIVNMLQQAFGEEIKFTNAIFGYSMLYPYTDNYLDSIEVNKDKKIEFNNRFTKRLGGEKIIANNYHEEQVYRLVQLIEDDFDRENYPEVYRSLNLIHSAQINSLRQQEYNSIPYEKDILGISIEKGGASVIADGNLIRGEMTKNEEMFSCGYGFSIPYEKDILGISIEKGGASVIADGNLIRGEMTKNEEMFSCGYGFLLQLGDDLQDIKDDLKNDHITIMSQLAGKYYLDAIVNKLINLTIKVVDDAECFVCKNTKELKELIKNNCIVLYAKTLRNLKN